MKVNAPEKLYIFNPEKREVWFSKTSDKQVEYTRTDAFIEKAAEWLDNNLWNYYDTGSIGDFEILKFEHFTQMIKDFKIAMKI